MKNKLLAFTLAVLTIGLLGSCRKINERIDEIDKRIDGIENNSIATINQQITGINSSIADLGTIRQNIQNLIGTTDGQAKDINDLEVADAALGARIDDLKAYVGETLKSYAQSKWVEATFATLEQHKWTCDTIAKIDARIGALDAELSKSIEDCASSLKSWVNTQLEGYYTAAQMDAKVTELLAQLSSASGESQAKADSLAKELTATKKAIETAKVELTEEYQSAIEEAIKTSEGKLSSRISSGISSANSKVSALASRVDKLETDVATLTGRVEALEKRIQSVTIIPEFSDGSVAVDDNGKLTINCIVSPKSALTGLEKDDFKVLLREVMTKSGLYTEIDVTDADIDSDSGIVEVTANISSHTTLADGKALTAALRVKDFTTDFVGVSGGITSNQTIPASHSGEFILESSDKVILTIEGGNNNNIKLKYASGSQLPKKLVIQVGNGGTYNGTISGYLPYTTVEFNNGEIANAAFTTASSTFIVIHPAKIGTKLIVEGGNVLIKGATVTAIEVAAGAFADTVTKAPVQIVVEKYTPAGETTAKVPVITEGIKASANVIVAPAATVEVKVTAQENVQVANEGQGTVTDSSNQPIETKASAKIGDATYITLSDALNRVMEGQTIEILNDIALDSPITISKSNIVIDGKDKTIAVSNAEYWNQYKVGGEKQGLGKCNMISVSANDFTLKNVTLDGKDCRGVSLCTTTGGKNILYQNITYKGRGSGHYYGEATGLVTFDGCKFDIHGYAIHFGGESSLDDDVVIKNCEVNGWSSFGSCKSLTISNSHFGGANDEGANGWLAVLRPYCPTTITNCTFSNIYLHEVVTKEYDCIGLGTGAATTVILNGCKVVNDAKQATTDEIYSIVRDNGFGSTTAQTESVFAFDAEGNAADGYIAGTFYASTPNKIKPKDGYKYYKVEGTEAVYEVREVEAVAKIGSVKYETLDAAFAVVQAEQTIEIVKAGTYKLPASLDNITISGVKGVEFDCVGTGSIASIPDGCTFENVSFKMGSSNYHGFQHAGTINMNDCTFEGLFFSYGNMNFTGCTFNQTASEYCMWDYGQDLTYSNCTFNCAGKFINVYNEGNGNWKLKVEGCTFNSTAKNKAAINIKASCGATNLGWDVTINNCKVNDVTMFPEASGVASSTLYVGSPIWQVDDRTASSLEANIVKVTVDGVVVYGSKEAE